MIAASLLEVGVRSLRRSSTPASSSQSSFCAISVAPLNSCTYGSSLEYPPYPYTRSDTADTSGIAMGAGDPWGWWVVIEVLGFFEGSGSCQSSAKGFRTILKIPPKQSNQLHGLTLAQLMKSSEGLFPQQQKRVARPICHGVGSDCSVSRGPSARHSLARSLSRPLGPPCHPRRSSTLVRACR